MSRYVSLAKPVKHNKLLALAKLKSPSKLTSHQSDQRLSQNFESFDMEEQFQTAAAPAGFD
ncbi:hypothetical protein E4U47_006490, partial [Claviceps purpurea]